MSDVFDFSKTLIRCHRIGDIMTKPKDAAAAKRGDLSETAKKYLIELFSEELTGRQKNIISNKLEKGSYNEEDAITLISLLDRVEYKKNTERLFNDFLTGEFDVYLGETVFKAKLIRDTKCSWGVETYFPNLSGLNTGYWWQIQGYLDLTGAGEGSVDFCLVDTAEHILNKEKRYLLNNMNVATEESPEYIEACAELDFKHKFGDILPQLRRLRYIVKRDDAAIGLIHERVIKCREYLSTLYAKMKELNFGVEVKFDKKPYDWLIKNEE